MDLVLNGPRPEPRYGAAMATINRRQGIMHAGYGGEKSLADTFLIDLFEMVAFAKFSTVDGSFR